MKRLSKHFLFVNSFCFCIDHKVGVFFISILYFLLTLASFSIYAFVVSIHAIYWQVLMFVINVGLFKGVRHHKMEYFLPWLVVMVMFLMAAPFLCVWLYFDQKNNHDNLLLGQVILGAGLPLTVIGWYFFVVVMSLFQRLSNPDDSIHDSHHSKSKSKAKSSSSVGYVRA